MSEKPRNRRTERQAEASRENGRKSRGPTTADGKRRSAENSTKHGVWSRRLLALDGGPLRENGSELESFVTGFVEELDPGDSRILRQMAFDVADKAWRVTRAQRWEAVGYSNPGTLSKYASQGASILHEASRYRDGAAIVRALPDPSIQTDDVLGAYMRLANHFGATEDSLDSLVDADAPVRMKALTSPIKQRFSTPEDAASLLETYAAELETEGESLYFSIRPQVVRNELDGAFSRNVERLATHSSRELDQSLKRYWQLRDRLYTAKPPNQPIEQSAQENQWSDTPDVSDRSESDVSALTEMVNQAISDNETLDLELFESLLDQIVEPTVAPA
ncbi:MAG: hypothetical protein WED83_02805 [Acidimicrobiia bacterium]